MKPRWAHFDRIDSSPRPVAVSDWSEASPTSDLTTISPLWATSQRLKSLTTNILESSLIHLLLSSFLYDNLPTLITTTPSTDNNKTVRNYRLPNTIRSQILTIDEIVEGGIWYPLFFAWYHGQNITSYACDRLSLGIGWWGTEELDGMDLSLFHPFRYADSISYIPQSKYQKEE